MTQNDIGKVYQEQTRANDINNKVFILYQMDCMFWCSYEKYHRIWKDNSVGQILFYGTGARSIALHLPWHN